MNLANLQLAGEPMYARDKPPYTHQQYEDKIAWTAQAVQALDADIIGFKSCGIPTP